MAQADFYNFSTHLDGTYAHLTSNKVKSLSGINEKVHWTKLRHIRCKKPEYRENILMLYKYAFDEPFRAVIIGTLPRRGKKVTVIDKIVLPNMYNGALPISSALKKDLISLCKANAISQKFHEYYYNIKAEGDTDLDDVDPKRESEEESDSDDE